jgi:hypothetical protein
MQLAAQEHKMLVAEGFPRAMAFYAALEAVPKSARPRLAELAAVLAPGYDAGLAFLGQLRERATAAAQA